MTMTELTSFQPVFLTILGIMFVVGAVVAAQQYIKRQVQPAEVKVDAIENELIELRTESRIEQTRTQEHWNDVKTTLEGVRLKLHELAIGQAEMKTAMFGHDGSNGIRGELRMLRQDVKELHDRVGKLERE